MSSQELRAAILAIGTTLDDDTRAASLAMTNAYMIASNTFTGLTMGTSNPLAVPIGGRLAELAQEVFLIEGRSTEVIELMQRYAASL